MKGCLCVLPWINETDIPLGIVFQALGICDYKEIAELCIGADYENDVKALQILNVSLEYSFECKTQKDALIFIGKKGRKFIQTKMLMEKEMKQI